MVILDRPLPRMMTTESYWLMPLGSTRLAHEQSFRIARKAAHGAQRHVADNASNPKIRVVDESAGHLLVVRKIGANNASDVVDGAAHFPALDHGIDGVKTLFEAAAIGLLFQDDLGKHIHRSRQVTQLDYRLISGNDAGGLESAHAFEA